MPTYLNQEVQGPVIGVELGQVRVLLEQRVLLLWPKEPPTNGNSGVVLLQKLRSARRTLLVADKLGCADRDSYNESFTF